MNKIFIFISLFFVFKVSCQKNNTFYGAYESNGVYYTENESNNFNKKFKLCSSNGEESKFIPIFFE